MCPPQHPPRRPSVHPPRWRRARLLLRAAPVVALGLAAVGGWLEAGATDPAWVEDPQSIQADYVLVSPERFRTETAALAATLRDLHGVRTQTITLDEIRTAFPGAISDSADTASIRSALAFAYERWRSAPLYALLIGDAAEAPSQEAYDLLPTPHFFQNEYGGWCDGTYAMDAWYGDVAGATGEGAEAASDRREIAIARLPVREAQQIDAYRCKLEAYVREQSPPGRAGLVVGDLSLLQENGNRRPAAQRLLRRIRQSADLDTSALYSYDFSAIVPPAGDYLPEEVGAGRDQIIALIDSGLAILEFFGNTYPADAVTHTLWYDGHPLVPQFRAAMLANTTAWPLAIFSHCKVGAFDEYADLGISPLEDFVLATERGAIAGVGKGQMTYFEADEPISHALYEQILTTRGGSCLGAQVHGGLERYLRAGGSVRAEAIHTARMVNLIGDPALRLKLPHPPGALVCDFELRGALALQDRLARYGQWVSADLDTAQSQTRLHNDELGPPLCGDPPSGRAVLQGTRSLALRAVHGGGGPLCAGAWTLFARRAHDPHPLVRLDPDSARTSVLCYWVRQDAAPGPRGRLFVELVASDGRLLTSDPDADPRDQYGRPYLPDSIDYPLREWHPVCVRLDDWARAGVGIDSVIWRYRTAGEGAGEVCGALDNLYIGPWHPELWGLGGVLAEQCEPQARERDNLLLNGAFRWDADADARPDFWGGAWDAGPEEICATLWVSGVPSVILDRQLCEPAALSQPLPRCAAPEGLTCEIELCGWPDDREDRLLVRLRDLTEGGSIVAEDHLTASADWDLRQLALDADPSASALCLELELLSGSVTIAGVRLMPRYGTSARSTDPRRRSRLTAWPRPARGRIRLRLSRAAGGASTRCAVRLYSVDGRCLASQDLLPPSRGGWELSLDALGAGRLPAGCYLLELRAGRQRAATRIVAVR
ncbi:MAG: hypothetical protein GF330_02115 [Candidatus Eisenbacteria bacterium]|nr:hypothetical protein [Candidatus Eisenbacteria bacterium]